MKTMKYLIAFLLVFVLSSCVEHIGYKDTDTWAEGEITIVIDSSVSAIGDPEKVHGIIEDSFLTWLDEVDTGIILNFEYRDCTREDNCVRYAPASKGAGGVCVTDHIDGYMLHANVTVNSLYSYRLYESAYGYDLRAVMLHEAGHFFGVKKHSPHEGPVMYGAVNAYVPGQRAQLAPYDIAAIQELYK